MKINEIFYSLQGEGFFSGYPTIFIRTSGCNLRCMYCDTKYAYHDGDMMSIEDIGLIIDKYSTKKVCLTGGEPLLQEDIHDLLHFLKKNEYYVTIETNGSIDISQLLDYDNTQISLDIKCPCSEMQDKMVFKNLKFLRKKDQLKLVVKDRNDFEYGMELIKKHNPSCEIFFQTIWNQDPKPIADLLLASGIHARLGIQLHKLIWGDVSGH